MIWNLHWFLCNLVQVNFKEEVLMVSGQIKCGTGHPQWGRVGGAKASRFGWSGLGVSAQMAKISQISVHSSLTDTTSVLPHWTSVPSSLTGHQFSRPSRDIHSFIPHWTSIHNSLDIRSSLTGHPFIHHSLDISSFVPHWTPLQSFLPGHSSLTGHQFIQHSLDLTGLDILLDVTGFGLLLDATGLDSL